MNLVSLKQKYSDIGKPSATASSDEYFPSLFLERKQAEAVFAEIGGIRVGEEMQMVANVRISSLSESKDGSRSVSFEIIEAGFAPKEKKDEPASLIYPNDKGG